MFTIEIGWVRIILALAVAFVWLAYAVRLGYLWGYRRRDKILKDPDTLEAEIKEYENGAILFKTGLCLEKTEGGYSVGSYNHADEPDGHTEKPLQEFTNLEKALAFVQLERLRRPYVDFLLIGFADPDEFKIAQIEMWAEGLQEQ